MEMSLQSCDPHARMVGSSMVIYSHVSFVSTSTSAPSRAKRDGARSLQGTRQNPFFSVFSFFDPTGNSAADNTLRWIWMAAAVGGLSAAAAAAAAAESYLLLAGSSAEMALAPQRPNGHTITADFQLGAITTTTTTTTTIVVCSS